MKIKISRRQLNVLLKEQEDNVEKTLSDLEYGINKPFSCVQYEPITIDGKKSFPKNYRNSVKHKITESDGDKKYSININFFTEWENTSDNIVIIKLLGIDDGKRGQSLEYAGKFNCTGRDIVIDLDTQTYYQANEKGSTKESDLEKQNSPFTSNPFSGSIPLKKYNSLDELGKEISKITFDHTKLNPIV
jgi:hypothetical protein